MTDPDLRSLSVSLRNASHDIVPEVRKVIQRGSLNIKTQMREDAAGHPHFPRLGPSITYDTREGNGWVEGLIGPGEGVLAGIAYYGSSRPGGATVEDPKRALEAEAPAVERHIGDIVGKVLR